MEDVALVSQPAALQSRLFRMKDTAKLVLAKAGPFLGLLVVIVLFSIPGETREFFLTYHNFKTIFTQTVIVAIGALGMTMIIVSGGIDLSVGSSIAFTSVVGALLTQKGWGPAPATFAVIGTGRRSVC
jgi:ribose transport system permease protein